MAGYSLFALLDEKSVLRRGFLDRRERVALDYEAIALPLSYLGVTPILQYFFDRAKAIVGPWGHTPDLVKRRNITWKGEKYVREEMDIKR